MRLLASSLSILFHPIFIPLYATLLVIAANPFLFGKFTSPDAIFIWRTVLLYTLMFPLFAIGLMYKLDFIDRDAFNDRRQRVLIYMPTSFFFMWTYIVLLKSDYNNAIADIMLGATVALSALLFFTVVSDKVSAHTVGMGGLVATALYIPRLAVWDTSPYLLAIIVLAGAVGTARLVLQAHNLRQVFKGYAIGFICQIIAFWF